MTTVPTALGDVPTGELGVVSTHEHLFINLMKERRGDGLLVDERLISDELGRFVELGGRTILDLTTAELTPGSTVDADPDFTAATLGQTRAPRSIEAIQRVSRATGAHVVLGTGRYRDPYLSADLIDRAGVRGIADEMVRDLTEGFPGTTARAGLIGEIGADAWFVSAREERVHRAAAAAHRETGAAIYTHSARWQVGFAQLQILSEAGADPTRIAVGHTDTVAVEGYAVDVARRGAFVGFDTLSSFAPAALPAVCDRIMAVVRAGFLERVLLGQDVCVASELAANGGTGFTAMLGIVRGLLYERGLDEGEFEQIVVRNPIALLGKQ